MKTRVRAGNAADAEVAVSVWRAASTARRHGVPLPAEHDERVRGYLRKDDTFFVVAEDASALAGVAVGMQALADDGTGPPSEGLCHISMVFVHPDRWGQGVGKTLIHHLLQTAAERGYVGYQLWTQADNERAQRLYEGLGFRRSGREKLDDGGEWSVHYELRPALRRNR